MLAVVFATGKKHSNGASGGSTVVENLANDPEIKGLILVDAGIMEEKMAKSLTC